jgi:hypothetical protein
MSQQDLETIIDKAMTDEQFRTQLIADPGEALKDYDISEDEIKQLAASMGDEFAGALETRLSKRKMGGKFGDFGAAGIDGLVD